MQFLYYLKSRGINLHLVTCGFFLYEKTFMILGLLSVLLLWVYYYKYHPHPFFVIAQRILLNLESFHTLDEVFIPVIPEYRLPSEQPMSIVNSTPLLSSGCSAHACTYHTKYPYLHGTMRIINKFTLFQNTAWVLWPKNFLAYFL